MADDGKRTGAGAPPAVGKRPGLAAFVFKYGLLPWGLGGGAAFALMTLARRQPTMAADLLWAAWFFPVLGMGAGLAMWAFGRALGGRKR